ncbi:MAG: hypothetical protein QNL91_06230 [Candidatus Krumholzibacteria bacterium]|nr:hypothetical protein [Candidatus Krumholzibacteria bacterium]
MNHKLPPDTKSDPGEGITSGRRWSALPTEGQPIEWSLDPKQGRIQGPLDLEFMRDQRMSLILEEGQQALLVQDGQLKAVYLDGAHYLEVGEGKRQIDPSCQLMFLALEESLQMSWSCSTPLQWGPQEHQALIGSCSLRVEWPSRFFATFLQGHRNSDPGFTERLIDQMVRGLFAEILAVGEDNEAVPGPAQIQEHLMRLTPADLNDDLNACGLNCTQLAVFTLAPPIEDHETADGPDLTLIPGR